MTKKRKPRTYSEAFKKYIRRSVNYWQPLLLLQAYSVGLKYEWPCDCEDENCNCNKSLKNATVDVDLTYERIVITIYPYLMKCWKEEDFDYIQRVLVHELCHAINWNYYHMVKCYSPNDFHSKLDDELEKVVTRMAHIMMANNFWSAQLGIK